MPNIENMQSFMPAQRAPQGAKTAHGANLEPQKKFDVQENSAQLKKLEKHTLNKKDVMGKMSDWLKLIGIAMKNINPDKPPKPGDMLNQFASLAQTMGMAEMKEHLIQSNAFSNTQQLMQALSHVGKMVEVEGSKFNYVQQADVPTKLGFTVPQEAHSASLIIIDAQNNIVRIDEGPFQIGENSWVWDGKNTTGQDMANGSYQFQVQAFDKAGTPLMDIKKSPIAVRTTVAGVMQRGQIVGGQASAVINGQAYPLNNLASIQMIDSQPHSPARTAENTNTSL